MASNDQRQVREKSRSLSVMKEGKKSYKSGQVYCYCREPAGDRFMIGCDACNEWYHGDCIKISSTVGRRIDKFYCPTCVSKNPDLTTTYRMKGYDLVANPIRCTECGPCTKQPDCGKCARCKAKDGRCLEVVCLLEGPKIEEKENQKRQHQKPPREVKFADDEDIVFVEEKKLVRRGDKGWKKQLRDEKKAKKGKVSQKVESETSRSGLTRVRNRPVQCWGPECVYESRESSKFCSDECGKNLARERLKILNKNAPDHWKVEPVDERLAREENERFAQEMAMLTEDNECLGQWHKLIIKYVDTLKNLYKANEVNKEPNEHRKNDVMINCVLCGEDYGSRGISKHIENCFYKKENKTTFTSDERCRINPHNILCDTGTKWGFCKRLRVLCLEHYKGDIEAGLEICGWPNVWNYEGSKSLHQLFDVKTVADFANHGLCTVARKECKLHCGWITTILGLIDVRRFTFYMRFDDEHTRHYEKKGNAWLLMANQTEHHQPLEQILKQYEEGSKNTRPK